MFGFQCSVGHNISSMLPMIQQKLLVLCIFCSPKSPLAPLMCSHVSHVQIYSAPIEREFLIPFFSSNLLLVFTLIYHMDPFIAPCFWVEHWGAPPPLKASIRIKASKTSC